tara:strand:+ start:1474 stop:1773 length:300 start_codon:yes stop_codon:yes gene_type:complete
MVKKGGEVMSDIILHEHCNCTQDNLDQLRLIGNFMGIVRDIHSMMASTDMRSRLAFGNSVEAIEKMQKLVEKGKKEYDSLYKKQTTNNTDENKQRGISL